MNFPNYEGYIIQQLQEIKEIVSENTDRFATKKANLENLFKEDLKENPEVGHYLIDAYEKDFNKYLRSVPSLFYGSFIVTIYSLLEFHLSRICRLVQWRHHLKIKISDINGEGYINTSRKYFELVIELDMEDLETSWSKIKDYQKIRNCIVHDKANIWKEQSLKLNKQKLYPIVMRKTGFELDTETGDFYIINDTPIIDFCSIIENYLTAIISKVKAIEPPDPFDFEEYSPPPFY